MNPDMVEHLRVIEETYKCAGICEMPDFYIFSNVNNGKPEKTCKIGVLESLTEDINYYLYGYGAVFIITVVIQFILYILLCYRVYLHCCKKKGLKQDLKAKQMQLQMAEIDGEAEDDEEPPAVQPAKGKKGYKSSGVKQ